MANDITPKTPRPHAELIKRWADDDSLTVWCWTGPPAAWTEAVPNWYEHFQYALGEKPTAPPRKMCILGGVAFPAPETKAPANGTQYYAAGYSIGAPTYPWLSNILDFDALETGRVHLAEQAAIAHSKALVAANLLAIEAAI